MNEILVSNLDRRICDVEEGADNTETYREFIRISEAEFEFEEKDLESLSDEDLASYIAFLAYLWGK